MALNLSAFKTKVKPTNGLNLSAFGVKAKPRWTFTPPVSKDLGLPDIAGGMLSSGTKTTTPAIQPGKMVEVGKGAMEFPVGKAGKEVLRAKGLLGPLPIEKVEGEGIAGIAKEVGQSISRNIASVIGSEALEPIVKPITEKVAMFERAFPTFEYFTEELANRLYGDLASEEPTELTGETRAEQIAPIGERVIAMEKRLEDKKGEYAELAQTPGLSFTERIVLESLSTILENKTTAPLFIGAYAGIDFLPFGGSAKGVTKAFIAANKLDDAIKVLTKLKLSDDLVKQFAPEVVKVVDKKAATKLLDSIINLQLTTKATPVAQKGISKAITAQKGIIPKELTQATKGVVEVPSIKISDIKPSVPIKPTKTIIRETTGQVKPGLREFETRIKDLARGAREGSIATRRDILKSGDELKAILKVADVDPSDAKWFTDTFKGIKGMDDLAVKMPTIIARAERLVNAREIRTLKSGIIDELKKGKPKIGQKKVLESKLGVEAQKQMDFLRGTTKESIELTSRTTKEGNVIAGMNGNRSKALTKIEENINKYGTAVDGVVSEVPPEIVRQNALLNMTGIQDMSVAELRSALNNIQSLKKTGQLEVLVRQSNKSARIELIQDTAKMEFRSAKVGPEVVGVAEREMNPVIKVADSIENAILGIRNITEKLTYSKEFKVADWLGDTIRKARNGHNRLGIELGNTKVQAFKRIFGEEKLGKIYQEMGKEKLVFSGKNALGNLVEMKLNQFEAAYWWGLAKDPTNIPIFTKNMDFTPEMLKALDKFVDPRMKKYTEYLMTDWLDKQIYPLVNARYQVKFGMDMPKNPNYLPRLYGDKKFEEEITNLLIGEAFHSHPSTVPSGVKARIGSKSAFRRINIEQVMRRHLEQMNQFVHFDEAISDARRVFTNPEVKNTILQSSGKSSYITLTNKIDDIARGGMATQMQLAAIDSFIGKFTQASLMLNWVPFLKQITSYPAFTLGRGGLKYGELLSGSMIYYRNPVAWTKKLAESDFIFGRLTKGFNRETAIAFRQGNKSFTIKEVGMTLEDFLGKAAITPTRGGDMVPIMPGMTAKYIQTTKHLQKTTKLSAEAIHKKALAAAETLASRTQQSPWIEDLGRIQSANSVGKAISMYSTTPIQFLRESIGSIRMWNRGQISKGEMLRSVITAWVILPQIFQYVSNGFSWNTDRQMRALLLGPINYYPAAGNLIGTMYDAFAKGETWKSVASGISPLFAIPETAQQSLASLNRIMFEDVEDPGKEWARFAEKLYETIALSTGKLPSSLPRTIEGIIDLVEGDTQDLRRLFFSEYALDTEEEKEPPREGGESMEKLFKDMGLPPLPGTTKELPKLPALPSIPGLPSLK